MNQAAIPPASEAEGVAEELTPKRAQIDPIKKVLIVWGMDAWETFHRREMLQALISNTDLDFTLLFIEPHYHAVYLIDRKLDELSRLTDYAMLKPRTPLAGVYTMRLLTMGFPAGMQVHPLLTQDTSLGAKAEEVAKHLFGECLEIIHWIYKPQQRSFIPPASRYIYEVYDDYTMDLGSGSADGSVVDLEIGVIDGARHVFFTSDVLAERKAPHARDWSVVENGVDFATFQSHAVPQRLGAAVRPRVGYLGNLSDFFDWETMNTVCRLLPEMDFVFHGQIEWPRLGSRGEPVQALLSLPNVEFTGRVSRSTGAASVARCDALVIPFVVNDAMHAVNPLKLWEYFAVGVPVVSSPMRAVRLPEPLLRIARTVDEWTVALRSAVSECSPSLTARRIALARARDWRRLTCAHAEVLLKL